jgi:P27 family predicted phage terminase small subunit
VNLSAKKPTNLKLLEGNPGKRPIKKQPKLEIKKLKCPIWLNKEAKKEWKRVFTLLEKSGLISDIDMTIFAMYCQNYARWKQAEEELNSEKLKISGQRGPIINPLIKISQTYQTRLKISIEKLGLSPSDRANLDIAMNDNNEDDGIAKYIR